VERLIGTLRREYLDHLLFWTTADLENKLLDFRTYFNNHRTHNSREANAGYAGVTTNRKSPLVSMAAPLPILVSDPNGCLTLSKTRAHFGIRSTSKNTWNEIIRYLRSWLQSFSRIRSFHCHRMRSESENQFTCAARLPVKSALP
jgi:hypothetical protein